VKFAINVRYMYDTLYFVFLYIWSARHLTQLTSTYRTVQVQVKVLNGTCTTRYDLYTVFQIPIRYSNTVYRCEYSLQSRDIPDPGNRSVYTGSYR
jgi:hypothetical protein